MVESISDKNLVCLIKEMLRVDPKNRMQSIEEVKKSAFMKHFMWNDLGKAEMHFKNCTNKVYLQAIRCIQQMKSDKK